ncbi:MULTISPECIES: TIGR02281 family clan AA aspartic protease [Rhizobium]|uniref:Aspartyl protease family protein n=1 Tax=Rhizobium miluonense TaxID=411945 RepID=A0A1C3WXC3_9HYPH|nr:TIGR02281 family clan AA aspartic protease [Rhizobium miluonense]SCB44621.1 aspartyl protease family protein [Rhizobium miluonense]
MLIADPEDRNGGRLPNRRGWFAPIVRTFFIFAALCTGIWFYLYGDRVIGYVEKETGAATDPALTEVYQHFDMAPLPNIVAGRAAMATYLNMLHREHCDWNAVYKFANELQTQGYRREAAKVFIAFSNKCKPSNVALSAAAEILDDLSDYDGALKISNEVIAMSPGMPNLYFQRARIRENAKKYRDAIDDYYSVIGLTDNIAILNSTVFEGISTSYRELGAYCEAIGPLQLWVSTNPDRNDTAVVRGIIKLYETMGKCASTYATGSDRFPTQGNNVILAKVSVNGTEGTFVVDTGASFVAVSKTFAARAKLQVDSNNGISLQTANGVSRATHTNTTTVKVGRVEASDITAVVLDNDAALGNEVDGLLGRSFLSRFDVTFGSREWRIEAKK